ncbi:peptidyl-prolyl cis-trans isomerase [Flavobacteriales bacterium]|nr:peptidyl-prolyl cis-trans isomerase [Flavobacteriales bacterium]
MIPSNNLVIRFFGALALIWAMPLAQHAQESGTILTVGTEEVSAADFQHVFLKNNRDSVITEAALNEYMELFINFKLKVQAAEALGMDTIETFQRELAGYRTQLARPYLTNNDLLQDLVKQAWERQQEEVRARHILVSCGAEASAADTLKAYKRALAMRKRVENGEDFQKVAQSKGGSDDPSVRDNGGDLGWFSAFQMIYSFEDAAYNTPVGSLSDIVRTRYGYHVLEVTGRRDARGEIRTAHIMIRTKEGASEDEAAQSESRIGQVYDLLQNGLPWEELAMKMSEDATTSGKGGELPWFGTGKMVEEFENAAFGLKADEAISRPFQTSYGWHIVKRLEYRAPLDFEASKRELQKRVSRDSRSELTRTSFLENLKVEYGFKANTAALTSVKRYASRQDSVFFPNHELQIGRSGDRNKTLVTLAGQTATVQDFADYLNKAKIRNLEKATDEVIDAQFQIWSEKLMLDYEDTQLEAKHNDFRLLMEEYHDGILLFELTDEKVWSRAVKDTAGLETFHATHRGDFMWGPRAELTIFTCANDKVVKATKKAIKKGKDLVAFQREANAENSTAVRMESGLFSEGENNWADQILAENAAGTLATGTAIYEGAGGETIVVYIQDLRDAEPKSLMEARGQVIAAYQDFLEAAWIAELRGNTTVEINRDLLQNLAD